MSTSVYLSGVAVVVLLLVAWVLWKVRRIHLMLYRMDRDITRRLDNVFHQVESLAGLYIDLDLRRSLPSTRRWAASPDFLGELVRHAEATAPHVVVECSSGVSTLILARCAQLRGSGHVYSLEHDATYAEKTRKYLERHGLGDWATVLHAPLRPRILDNEEWLWYSEDVLPAGIAVDLLVIDGPPHDTAEFARYPAGPLLFHKLAPYGAIFLDDAARPPEQAIIQRWQRENPDLRCELVPCEKGCARLWLERS